MTLVCQIMMNSFHGCMTKSKPHFTDTPLLRPCQGGSHFPCLNFKMSWVGVNKCLSLIVGFAVTVAIWQREVVSCRDFILRTSLLFGPCRLSEFTLAVPHYYPQFSLSLGKAFTFSLDSTCLIQKPLMPTMDNWQFGRGRLSLVVISFCALSLLFRPYRLSELTLAGPL